MRKILLYKHKRMATGISCCHLLTYKKFSKEKLPKTGEPPEAIPYGHTASLKHIFCTHCILPKQA